MEYTYSESNVIDSFLHLLRTEENGMWVSVLHKNPNLGFEPTDYLPKQKSR